MDLATGGSSTDEPWRRIDGPDIFPWQVRDRCDDTGATEAGRWAGKGVACAGPDDADCTLGDVDEVRLFWAGDAGACR